MAKTEGTQSIPSELLDAYRATLGEQRPNLAVQKRYPFHVPTVQDIKGHPSAKQRIQRWRFKYVYSKFNLISYAERQRWYAAMPEWGSLLWYYNFFILSGIMGVLGAIPGGAQVIKTIQNRILTVPLAGTTITHATVIDASKAVVMLWGGSYDYHAEEVVENVWWAAGWPVYPLWGTLTNTNISLTWTVDPLVAGKVAVQVIEYI